MECRYGIAMKYLRDRISDMRDEDEQEAEASSAADGRRFKTCSVCGQTFDTQNLDHVYHHGPEPHLPLIDES